MLEIIVVGRKCTYEGQELDITIVEKVMKWLEYRNVLEVRKFLRIASIVRNWIKGFAEVVDPLTKLTRVTESKFSWEEVLSKISQESPMKVNNYLFTY